MQFVHYRSLLLLKSILSFKKERWFYFVYRFLHFLYQIHFSLHQEAATSLPRVTPSASVLLSLPLTFTLSWWPTSRFSWAGKCRICPGYRARASRCYGAWNRERRRRRKTRRGRTPLNLENSSFPVSRSDLVMSFKSWLPTLTVTAHGPTRWPLKRSKTWTIRTVPRRRLWPAQSVRRSRKLFNCLKITHLPVILCMHVVTKPC